MDIAAFHPITLAAAGGLLLPLAANAVRLVRRLIKGIEFSIAIHISSREAERPADAPPSRKRRRR